MVLDEKRARVKQARLEGKKLHEIASELGVSRARVMQVLDEVTRIQALPAWVNGLQIATARLVTRKFRNKHELCAALNSGARIDRIGPTREAELRKWLQAEKPIEN